MNFTRENKLKMYYERLSGKSWRQLSKDYNVLDGNMRYIFNLIEMHGIEILYKTKNNKYSKVYKEAAINRILVDGESNYNVSIELGLPNQGTLHNWIRNFTENGYNIIEKKRGRQSSMTNKPKQEKNNKVIEADRLKQLEKENKYLKAENEFLKKWNTVVQQEEKKKQSK